MGIEGFLLLILLAVLAVWLVRPRDRTSKPSAEARREALLEARREALLCANCGLGAARHPARPCARELPKHWRGHCMACGQLAFVHPVKQDCPQWVRRP
jgi:hypothetical protein